MILIFRLYAFEYIIIKNILIYDYICALLYNLTEYGKYIIMMYSIKCIHCNTNIFNN